MNFRCLSVWNNSERKLIFFSRRANLVVFMALQGLMEQITFIQLRQMDSATLDHNSFFYTPCCLGWPNFFAFFCTTSWFSTYSYFALNCLFHTKTNKTNKACPKTSSGFVFLSSTWITIIYAHTDYRHKKDKSQILWGPTSNKYLGVGYNGLVFLEIMVE